jgi:serine/threonine protein kinase
MATTVVADAPSGSGAAASSSGGGVVTYKIGRAIAQGGFGTVYLGLDSHGCLVAIKEIKCRAKDEAKLKAHVAQLRVEIGTLRRLKHPNMVGYIASERIGKIVRIVMEYVTGGSILNLLDQFGPLPTPVAARFTKNIIDGLMFLHSHNIVHRDVKCANVLVDVEGVAKLSDFGSAEILSSEYLDPDQPEVSVTRRGTFFWLPPEALRPVPAAVDKSFDVWALGCTVMEMVTGKPPWAHLGIATKERLVAVLTHLSSTSEELEIDVIGTTVEARGFIKRCLRANPSERASLEELLLDPFIAGRDHLDRVGSINDPRSKATLNSRIESLSSLANTVESINTQDFQDSHSIVSGATHSSGLSVTFREVESHSGQTSMMVVAASTPPSPYSPSLSPAGDYSDRSMKRVRQVLSLAELAKHADTIQIQGDVPSLSISGAQQIAAAGIQGPVSHSPSIHSSSSSSGQKAEVSIIPPTSGVVAVPRMVDGAGSSTGVEGGTGSGYPATAPGSEKRATTTAVSAQSPSAHRQVVNILLLIFFSLSTITGSLVLYFLQPPIP